MAAMNFLPSLLFLQLNFQSMLTVLNFIEELTKNNNRDWFHANKPRYQESLEIFRGFAGELLAGITKFDPSLGNLEPKDTIFRIYKDVRFSKDKLPYKTHFGCWMAKGGRKSTDAGYYFHLEPGKSFMAAGIWMPPMDKLTLIRQEIQFNPQAYLDLINTPAMQERYERGGKEDMLKKGPAGFPKDFIHMEELKYKHYIWSRPYSDASLGKNNFADRVAKDYSALLPLVSYLNHVISFTGNE
jgi:uncharacterized protein (TIGR02453 family)